MHDCILSIFWPKRKILDFFRSIDCPNDIIAMASSELPRHEIVSTIFRSLVSRPDRGYEVFQVMIDRLSNWGYFDSYYFDKINKLDRAQAQRNILKLKQMIEARNAATNSRRSDNVKDQNKRKAQADLSSLHAEFQRLFGTSMSVQERGRLFEKFLKDIFERNAIKMGDPFRLDGEQIDGTFKFEGENYIVEAKWHDQSTSTGDLYKFAYKVDGKMHGRGLFISVNGFSNESIRANVHGKHIKTILMDGEDISHVLEGRINLQSLLDFKIRAAQTRGEVYICAIRNKSKV